MASKRLDIAEFMRQILEDYRCIRGKNIESCGRAFWDMVVITTADKLQQEAFVLQVEEKFNRAELPLNVPIHIVSDPPGIRIGNGGSTFTALEFLENKYGENLFSKKILLIHAGGWSQRMPSASILGKAFSPIPHGNPPYQMLDLKLALYWPLVDHIEPGVFLACADDFIIYHLGSNKKEWKLPAGGFTALAHPSPIDIGRTHGVFVVKDVDTLNTSQAVEVRPCLKILQKPNDDRMRGQGALLPGTTHTFAGGICLHGEAVYTDSCFYFGTDVMKKLLKFKHSVGDLGCEIDAYGDFLQAVGERATADYVNLTANVSQPTINLIEMRRAVFDCLQGTDARVLILNASKYIHIGTAKELLHHLCRDTFFQHNFSLQKYIFNAWTGKRKECLKGSSNNEREEINKDEKSTGACIMHSFINSQQEISYDCVIDYCHFDVPAQIGSKCIISNCQYLESQAKHTSSHLNIPSDLLIHTVPIFVQGGNTKYVTIFFQVDDNLKKTTVVESLDSLSFMSSDIGSFLRSHGLHKNDVLPSEYRGQEPQYTSGNGYKISLWNLKLFPAMDSMTSSLEDAIFSLSTSGAKRPFRAGCILYSLADLLQQKDVRTMLKFRNDLFLKIKESKGVVL